MASKKIQTVDFRKVISNQINDAQLKETILGNLDALQPHNAGGPGSCKRWCIQGTVTVCCDPPQGESIASNSLLLEKEIDIKPFKSDGSRAYKKTIQLTNMTDYKIVAVSKKASKVSVTIPGKPSFELEVPFRIA